MARDTVGAAINGDLGAWRRRHPVPLDNDVPGRSGREDRVPFWRCLRLERCAQSRQTVLQLLKPRDQVIDNRLQRSLKVFDIVWATGRPVREQQLGSPRMRAFAQARDQLGVYLRPTAH